MRWFWQKKTIPPPKETRPDRVEYCLCFACEQGHCSSVQTSGTTIRDVQWDEQICSTCGAKAFPAVVRVVLESYCYSYPFEEFEKSREFVRFLDEGTVRLSDEAVTRLRSFAARTFSDVDEDSQVSYKNGLHDGAAMTALYVLGELKEETNA